MNHFGQFEMAARPKLETPMKPHLDHPFLRLSPPKLSIHDTTMKLNDHTPCVARLLPMAFAVFAAMVTLLPPHPVSAQGLMLANPHWNITLSDFGYSDFLLDNTPGFEGREYLSGEWAAAVAYKPANGTTVLPQWLEPHFIFPDWDTHSTFHVVTPLTQTGLNADGLPIAQSVITNNHLEITLRHEMLDTVVGTPMGTVPASAGGTGTYIQSDRYALKQTCVIRNVSGAPISNLQFFQFLHGLSSQRGVYDNRLHPGPFSEFRYDATLAGVDAAAVGAGSSSGGLEDFISLQASAAPSGYEIGYYGVEGNGADDHAIGKPSEGVHLCVENNWSTPPYSSRLNTDQFAPAQRWIAGAQRWELGNLAAGQTASFDVLLTLRTGTRVTTGTGIAGGCNGGSSVPGGVDYEFEDVSSEGSCFGEYSQANSDELAIHIAEGEFEPFTFLTPGGPAQVWKLQFSGAYSGTALLTFGYDPLVLPSGFDESTLSLYQFTVGSWQKLPGTLDPLRHTIAVATTSLGTFALGVESLLTFTVSASTSPPNSGTISGAGAYADGSSVTLVASANTGYVFSNWTETGMVVSASPSYTFLAHDNRALTANFIAVGTSRAIATSALPSYGGSTSGDGAYALGASATVAATPNAGYKFSKWLDNDVVVSTARSYTFTVTGDRALVAKFKPVYSVSVSAEPANGGEVEADPFYEAGEPAVLKAKPNPGYSFVNWTQNGTTVSDDAIYSFNVTANRTLVGHFAPGHRMDVLAEPANAGTVIGGGVYANGASVTVKASANLGYVFLNWSESGMITSTSPSLTFISGTNRTLVANFIAQPGLAASVSQSGVLTLSWPAGASGWLLQETPDLSAGSWMDSTRPVNIIDGRKQVNVSPLSGKSFFRLVHP